MALPIRRVDVIRCQGKALARSIGKPAAGRQQEPEGDDALDLTTPAGRAMAGLLAIFAEFEREVLRERTRAGLAEARQNGKRLGRPETAARHADEIRKLHLAGISKSEIARRLQIGRTSVRRILGAKS